ncbi:MAG: hypothetical protein HY815_25120 [Candidatus Riflebacteria bacterium]|nr:hypothetical protein [Candidatus Riflebacteria bacterium]
MTAAEKGRVDLGKVASSELPETLQDLDREALEMKVDEMAKKRARITGRIDELSKEREACRVGWPRFVVFSLEEPAGAGV